jgi:hypothetical protein
MTTRRSTSRPRARIEGATDGTLIGNEGDKLKVLSTLVQSTGSVPSVNSKLRYSDMNATEGGVARGTSITNAAWVTVFGYAGKGLLHSFSINLETDSLWLVRFLVDGEEIFGSNGIATSDMVTLSLYDLNSVSVHLSNVGISIDENKLFVWTCPSGWPVRYSTSVSILLRRATGAASKKIQAGIVVLTKE